MSNLKVWRRPGGIEPHTLREYTGFEVRCQGPPQLQVASNKKLEFLMF